jgi:predicted patatin/cPLA2 family phospholipase
MSLRSFLKTGDICGAKFCFYDIPDSLVPFAHESYENSTTDFYCVCTDVKTGQAVYHKCGNMSNAGVEWVRASASMPMVSRNVEIDGMQLLDGGIADSVPFRKFIEMGYNKTVVVCTQHDSYRKEKETVAKLMPLRYGKASALVKAMENRPAMYNAQLDDLKQAEQNAEVFVIRPSEPLHIGRIEHDAEVIRQVYMLGRKDAQAALEAMQLFISS